MFLLFVRPSFLGVREAILSMAESVVAVFFISLLMFLLFPRELVSPLLLLLVRPSRGVIWWDRMFYKSPVPALSKRTVREVSDNELKRLGS